MFQAFFEKLYMINQLYATGYGFAEHADVQDWARWAQSSDYAKAMAYTVDWGESAFGSSARRGHKRTIPSTYTTAMHTHGLLQLQHQQ